VKGILILLVAMTTGEVDVSKTLEPHPQPWCICRLGAKPSNRIIRRYVNRQDAEKDLSLSARFVGGGGQYVVAFDVVEIEE
jgi:hypothetical protein